MHAFLWAALRFLALYQKKKTFRYKPLSEKCNSKFYVRRKRDACVATTTKEK